MQNYLSNVIRALLKVYFKCNLGPRFIIHTYYTYICAYLRKKEKDQSKQCVHRRWQDFSWMVGLLVLLLPILSKYFLNIYSESRLFLAAFEILMSHNSNSGVNSVGGANDLSYVLFHIGVWRCNFQIHGGYVPAVPFLLAPKTGSSMRHKWN